LPLSSDDLAGRRRVHALSHHFASFLFTLA
jgi:hypothetical protein